MTSINQWIKKHSDEKMLQFLAIHLKIVGGWGQYPGGTGMKLGLCPA